MEKLIDAIRCAVADDASAETRAAGAQACRTILAALEAKPGEPLAAQPAVPVVPPTHIHALASALRTMPLDEILDLAIRRLQASLPPGVEVSGIQTVRIPLVPISPGGQ